MSKIQAYSAVVVTDSTDVGQLNLYLTSNQPTTVIYDPNQNIYTPNWSTSNLVITPVVSYNGANLSLDATGLTVTFTRKEGSGTATALSTGETVSSNVLTVAANKLENVSSKLLTYVCDVTYTDPNARIDITVQATLTFSLVSNATEMKSASITGESTFLYDTNRTLVGSNTIVLSANLVNVSVVQWQYKNASDEFVAFPTTNNSSITGTTLNVLATESDIWVNDKMATIKLVTDDSTVYDIHNIVKIYDGAAGTDTVSAVLSNENHLAPADSDGNVTSLTGAETEIHIYEGGEDVTSEWTITVITSTGLEGTYDASSHKFTPTSLTGTAGSATFTCKRDGYNDIIKVYTITAVEAGADGADAVIYAVEPNTYVLNLSEAGVFTPSSVTFTAYKTTGNNTKANYSGRFIISESTDGSTYVTKYTSGSDEYSKTYSPSDNTVKSIQCILYESGGTTKQLDSQTVVITSDGATGADGDDGKNGVSVVVGNDSEVIPCTSDGLVAASKDIQIPFYGYDGISKAAITCQVGTLPTGTTIKSNTAGTTTSGGLLVLTVAKDATLGGASLLTGDITLTLTCNGQSVEKKFTWTKSLQAVDGAAAVVFQLYSPDGGTIYNGEGTTTLNTMLMSGAETVTATSYTWAKFTDGDYVTITDSDDDDSSFVVEASMVDATSWFRCEAVYNGVTYTAYWTVNDKSDPVQAVTIATIANFESTNSCAAIYTRIYRNGEEIDPIKTLVFTDTAPTGASAGDYYYHLDRTAKTCVLMKYSGTAWVEANENDEWYYYYYRINSEGVELDTTAPYKNTRCFYIDPSIINGQTQFRCKVSNVVDE